MLILNLKTYPEAISDQLVRILDSSLGALNSLPTLPDPVLFAPSLLELLTVKRNYPQLTFISQHVDAIEGGAATGWIPATQLVSEDIHYSIYNHAEHRLPLAQVQENISLIQMSGLKLIVCVESLEEAMQILDSKPYAIALENKDLIGSGQSIATQRPDEVQAFIDAVGDRTIPVIGAGISSGEDIRIGKELGARGFILSSRFVKAADHGTKLLELLEGMS